MNLNEMTDIIEDLSKKPILVAVRMSQETIDAYIERYGTKQLKQGDALGVRIIVDSTLPFKAMVPEYR